MALKKETPSQAWNNCSKILTSMLKTQKDKKLENFFSSNNKTKKKKNISVGLSGGVDSSL